MKREIKFRAWDSEMKIMIYPHESNYRPHHQWFTLENTIEYANMQNGFCTTEIMQFTGLKDKNGKEIYEGDILHRILFDKILGTIDVFAQVMYNSQAGLFEAVSPEENFFETVISDFEWDVVGNIYESPELLK